MLAHELLLKKCPLVQPLISPCNKIGEGGGRNGKKQDSTPSFGNGIVTAFQLGDQLGYGACHFHVQAQPIYGFRKVLDFCIRPIK
jgi:hypothetical protein